MLPHAGTPSDQHTKTNKAGVPAGRARSLQQRYESTNDRRDPTKADLQRRLGG